MRKSGDSGAELLCTIFGINMWGPSFILKTPARRQKAAFGDIFEITIGP
jgi:hypothetical protein